MSSHRDSSRWSRIMTAVPFSLFCITVIFKYSLTRLSGEGGNPVIVALRHPQPNVCEKHCTWRGERKHWNAKSPDVRPSCGLWLFSFFDEAPWLRGVPALHKRLVAGKMVQRCGRLGRAADYKSPTGKGFLMQHSVLATSIFCHGTVKDESPRGNSSPWRCRALSSGSRCSLLKR